MSSLNKVIKQRRSIYTITKQISSSDDRILQIVREAVLHSPSAFNMQESRIVLLLGKHHDEFWNEIVLNTLISSVTKLDPKETQKKIATYVAGYGTILFFEDEETTKKFIQSYATYSDQFPAWAHHSNGMLQITLWYLLTQEGLGTTLQHYNPLIDEAVKNRWHIPIAWKLVAQMPFGKPSDYPDPKPKLPLEERILIYK